MIIGERIKEAREAKKLSQKELAEIVGVDPSQFSKIEKGKVMPTLIQTIDIAKTLDQSLDWLVGHQVVLEDAAPINYKEQYEMAMQNIKLMQTITELKDRIHALENDNRPNIPVQTTYPFVAEPEHELIKKPK